MEQSKSPKFTAAGSPILTAWPYRGCADGSLWQTPPPILVSLQSLREAEFTWAEDAVRVFFRALFSEACERRIAEGHKGLLNSAADTLAKAAIAAFYKACRKQHIVIEEPCANMPDMIEPIIDEMINRSRLKSYADTFFRFLAKVSLIDCELTHNHFAICVNSYNDMTPDALYELAELEHLESFDRTPRMEFNQVLDIIGCYTDPLDRIKFRPLETLLTAANRVIYVIANRAY